ncbi:hypothetical protein RUND412_005895 [Rhizina undulata]
MLLTTAFSLFAIAATAFAAPVDLEERATSGCASLELIFARGTIELQGLGIVGYPLSSNLKKLVPDLSTYAVVYPASVDFAFGPGKGASDIEKRITARAAECPNMKFAVAGYSQGAMVVHSIKLSTELKSKIAAIAVFGDPYRLLMSTFPINDQTAVYKDCASGDPVCLNGVNVLAHLSYAFKTNAAAQFIAKHV